MGAGTWLVGGWCGGESGGCGGHRVRVAARLLRVRGPLRGAVAGQRESCEERARPQDRHFRRGVVGGCGCSWDGPSELCAATGYSGSAGADPLPQDPDPGSWPRDPALGEALPRRRVQADVGRVERVVPRSEEQTSELQSLMRISYAVFCLKKKNTIHIQK